MHTFSERIYDGLSTSLAWGRISSELHQTGLAYRRLCLRGSQGEGEASALLDEIDDAIRRALGVRAAWVLREVAGAGQCVANLTTSGSGRERYARALNAALRLLSESEVLIGHESGQRLGPATSGLNRAATLQAIAAREEALAAARVAELARHARNMRRSG